MRVRFNLQSRKIDPARILLVFRYGGKKFVYYTGQYVPLRFWDVKKGRAVGSGKFVPHKQLNSLLSRLEQVVLDTYLRHINNGNEPTFADLKAACDAVLLKRPTQNTTLCTFMRQLIEERKRSGNYSAWTVKGYYVILHRLEQFEAHRGKKIRFEDISLDLFYELSEWSNAQNYRQNTQRKTVQTLKAFLNEALERGLTDNKAHLSKRFTIAHETTQTVYLNLDELKRMYEVELPPHLDRIRDLFLLGCFTGLRFGDVSNLQKSDVVTLDNRKYIRKVMSKTRSEVLIPLHPIVRFILSKYDGHPPPGVANQYLNDEIKNVAKLAGIVEEVTLSHTVRGRLVSVTHPKYTQITSHTARRSFATNAFLSGVPIELLMKITGHKTEKAFRRYIRAGAAEYAVTMNRHSFFEGLG